MKRDQFIRALLEVDNDDDQTIADILGADYREEPEPDYQQGEVDRHGRWADIKVGDKNFCISYLTPVAVYLPGEGVKITDRYWSVTTAHHMVKWAKHIGMGFHNWADMQERCDSMPQVELLQMFKDAAQTVRWTKRQAKTAKNYGNVEYGLKSSREDHIDVEPSE